MQKRVKIIAAVAMIAAAAALAGLTGSSVGSASTGAANVHLTIWWWGETEAKGASKWLAQTIKLYEQQHPNVTISTVLQPTDSLVPSFKAAAAAKKGPDIQYFWGGINALEDAWLGNIKPVSDYIPKSELKHYLNAREETFGGKVWTAPWYVQPSFPVLYRKDILAKAGLAPPRTWSQLMAACSKLSSMGLTALSGGIKDGWFGGWLWSILGMQSVKSTGDVVSAVAGMNGKKFTDPALAQWWTALQQLRDHHCWNNDITSLQNYQAQQQWVSGKSAMTVTAGSDVKKFIAEVGRNKVGVMAFPEFAHGPYAGKLGSTSQTMGITAWTKYPQEAASFIQFMHRPDRMKAWFEITGSFFADDRFDKKLVTMPQQQVLLKLMAGNAPYLENFIPVELDTKAMFANCQLLLGGSMNAQQAAAATQQTAERIQRTARSEADHFKQWTKDFGA